MCYVNIFHVMPRVSALAGCDNNQDDDQEDGQNDEDQDDVNERIDSDNNEESDEESNEESDEEIQGANVEEEELDLSEFGISSWRDSRVDGRFYRHRIGFRMKLVQGATPIYEGSCRLTSLERQEVWNDCRSCKVRVGSNGNLLWEASVLLGRKKGGVHGDDVAKTGFRMRNGHVEVYGYAFWVNQCTSGFHGVNEPGGVRVAREDDRGVTEGREDVREVFQQRGSRAERKLSRCGRNQMGNESILALPKGVDDFVVYYDERSKDLEACLEKKREKVIACTSRQLKVLMKDCMANVVRTYLWRDVRTLAIEEAYTTKYYIHPGADTMLCGFRLTNRWLSMKKDIASCGSKYLAYSEVDVEL
ncbi:hypothetical protein Tco_0248295 [Tanacetum coccineum]